MLKIENLWGVTGSGLGNLTNLKELHSYRCSILRSENFISIGVMTSYVDIKKKFFQGYL